jgi:uncharacterized protein (TIRG00374 family)
VKLDWRALVGFALSIALLTWALGGIDFVDVANRLRTANVPLLVGAAAASTVIFWLRARRWRVILEPVAAGVPIGPLWRATTVGMMVSNVIPARVGEVARAFALTREVPRVPFSASFASIAVDRVFDAVVILLLTFAAMFDPAFPDGQLIAGRPASHLVGGWGTLALAVVVVALYTLVFFPARIISLFELFARRVAPRYEARGRELIQVFAAGLGVLRSPRRFAAVFAWTVLHWVVNAAAYWMAFRAVGVSVPATAALFLQGVIALGVALPSSPGFFGVFEKFGETGLGVYGVPKAPAVTWAIAYHLVSFLPVTVIGAVYFARMGVRFRELRDAGDGPATAAAE